MVLSGYQWLPVVTMWPDVKKIIDTLHIQNHKHKQCRELYSPESVIQVVIAFPHSKIARGESEKARAG